MPEPTLKSEPGGPGEPDLGPPAAAAADHRPDRIAWQVAILIALALIAYLPLWRAGFIWDDDTMLTANRLIRAGDGLYQFWATRNSLDYWPVTSTSLWLEWRLWGLQPLGYHLTNLALHLAEVLLLWSVLRRLRVPGAWLAALLFAVHPLNVESVTWIAQRKNLLALLFDLLAVRWFLQTGIVEPGPRPLHGRWYWLSVLAFALAMLSKGSVAPLPLVLAGIIAWRRRFTGADFLRLVPFGAVAGVLAAVDVWFQRHGTAEVIRSAGFPERLLGAGAAIWFYLYKSLWPARLMFVYPQWQIRTADPRWWLPLLAALALTLLLWRLARRERLRPPGGARNSRPFAHWGRASLFAWAYFCVSLAPVLGFTDVYFMKYSLVADHYAHLALIGVVAWAGYLVQGLWRLAAAARRLLVLPLVVVVGALAGLTWRQNLIYRDSFVLYRAILEENPGCWMAHTNLGALYQGAGDWARAIEQYQAALLLRPNDAEVHNNLGEAWLKVPGRLPDAIGQLEAALRLRPELAEAHQNLALALGQTPGQLPAAIAHYEEALRLKPDYAEAHNHLALTLASLPGRRPEAIAHFEAAVRLKPDYAEAHLNLALALAQTPGRLPETIAQYEQALRLLPDSAEAHDGLALALAQVPGRLPEAIAHYEQALRLRPDYAEAHNNLAAALAQTPGRMPEAIAHFEAAVRLEPDDAEAHYNLALADAQTGRLDASIRELQTAVSLNPELGDARGLLAKLQASAGADSSEGKPK